MKHWQPPHHLFHYNTVEEKKQAFLIFFAFFALTSYGEQHRTYRRRFCKRSASCVCPGTSFCVGAHASWNSLHNPAKAIPCRGIKSQGYISLHNSFPARSDGKTGRANSLWTVFPDSREFMHRGTFFVGNIVRRPCSARVDASGRHCAVRYSCPPRCGQDCRRTDSG